jgi:hypothetical protein
MLGRLKFKIDPLVEKILNHYPTWVWKSDKSSFLDPAMGGGQFLAGIERRLRAAGHSDDNIRGRVFGFESNKIRVNYAVNTHSLVSTCSVKTIEDFFIWNPEMKFDVVVGNPPYNKGLLKDIKNKFTENASGYPHLAFVNKSLSICKETGIVSLLMPASFMTLISCDGFRREIVSKFGLENIFLYDNRKNQIFEIEHTWVSNVFFSRIPGSGIAKYTISENDVIKSFSVNLAEYTALDNGVEINPWPMFTNELSSTILLKAKLKSKPLRRATAGEDLSNKHYVGFVLQGEDDNPCVNAIPMSKKGNGEIKSPGFLIFDNHADAVRFCRFMKTKTYKFLLSTTKCISKTQPQFISLIGNFDFPSDTFTDAELYTYFGLTQEEIDHLEATVKS